jgi:hypothetical protein
MCNFKYYNHDPKMSKQTLVTEDILLFLKKQLLDDLTHDLLGIVCL